MNRIFSTSESLAQITSLAQLAEWAAAEIGFGVAVVLTFSGMVLHWQLPRRRMEMEERMKDGKMTEEQARRHLQIWNWCAPIVTLVGVVLLLVALLKWNR